MIKWLGQGGNGTVWLVSDDDGQEAALKVIHPNQLRKRVRVERFKREIRFLLDNPEFDGILPLVDTEVDVPNRLLWYVMPKAVPVRYALGSDPDPARILECCASIADTLARLADMGVGHRDVKPENLFLLGGKWVVGDFGLVTYPEKDPITKHGRRLGPLDYMAPEMRSNADSARAESADVYSLAKTLWVLLTDEDLPLPGPHRLDDPAYAISGRLRFTKAGELDHLLEKATRNDPTQRPTLREFEEELRMCLCEPAEKSASPNMSDLTRRISSLTEAGRRRVDRLKMYQEQANDLLNRLVDSALQPVHNLLSTSLHGFDGQLTDELAAMFVGSLFAGAGGVQASRSTWIFPGPPSVSVHVVVGLGHDENMDVVHLIGLSRLILYEGGQIVTEQDEYRRIEEVPVGSAKSSRVVSEIAADLQASIPKALRVIASWLATDQTKGSGAG